jgi:hypothetical protein
MRTIKKFSKELKDGWNSDKNSISYLSLKNYTMMIQLLKYWITVTERGDLNLGPKGRQSREDSEATGNSAVGGGEHDLSRVLRAARLQPPLELVAAPVLTQQLRRGRRHPRRRLGPLLGPVRAPESHSSASLAACVGLRGGGVR